MWLSEKAAEGGRKAPEAVTSGCVSIGGADSAVVLAGEERGLCAMAPGGIAWLPESGQQVVVLRDAEGAKAVAGCVGVEIPDGLEPGELYLFSHGAAVYIKNNGDILLRGNVDIDGTLSLNGTAIVPVIAAAGGDEDGA